MTSHDHRMALPVTASRGRALLPSIARVLRDRRQYRDLEALPDHMLRDIGLTRSDVRRAKQMNWPF
ncbi:MAG: DUF1127 domain-containing protein [Pseudomonadota bacterium]